MNQPDRRAFLKGAGVSLALPMLEHLWSPQANAAAPTTDASATPAKRLICVGVYLGFYQRDFFPATAGRGYDMSPVLKPIAEYRDEMTIFSGLDHRGRNGHEGWRAWMSGRATGSVSMDQLVADAVGDKTRFASLQLTCGSPPGAAKLSFTKEGVALPMIGRPSVLYRTLFQSGSDKIRMEYLLKTNQSVLDGLMEEARSLERKVTTKDREKLGEYFASVRDVEKKLQKQQLWLDRPTPKVDYPLPEFDPVAPDVALECESIMYDLMALALTTDSTRVMTFLIPGWSQVFTINNRKLSAGYHSLSHHGNEPAKIAEYNLVGMEHVKRLGGFLDKLRTNKDAQNRPLIDSTTVVYGSGMGDANTHDNTNLPTLLVGGGYRHGQHHQIDRNGKNPRVLGDLFLTLMQQFGIQSDQFAGAKSNMNELSVVEEAAVVPKRTTTRRDLDFVVRGCAVVLATLFLYAPACGDESLPSAARTFLTKYCAECHLHNAAEGEVHFDMQPIQWHTATSTAFWERAYNAIAQNEMPPTDADQPSDEERQPVVEWLESQLTRHAKAGGTVLRRLNREEYENTIRDMFDLREFKVPESFPSDDSEHGL